MIKNTSIHLVYFIGFILGGLLLSQLILFLSLSMSGDIGLAQMQDSAGWVQQLSGRQLMTQQLISQVCSLILPCFLLHKFFMKDASFSLGGVIEPKLLFKSLIFFLLLMPLVGLSAYLNQLVPVSDWVINSETQMLELMKKMFHSKTTLDFLMALVVIAIIPAIAEEWAFRGVLQNYLMLLTGKKWIGLLLASILFSAVHMQFLGFLPRFILGWILGFIFLRTGNLWYSIFLHFINNATQLVAIYAIQDHSLDSLLEKSEMPNLFAVSICTLLAIWFGIIAFKSKLKIAHA
ncbi:MAG: CPBP family intramembrane metalloprotease [Saprospiraceae bacterium]|nr:CPBP family intramembrane metalloprotease [Saprospiraceae bacterium]